MTSEKGRTRPSKQTVMMRMAFEISKLSTCRRNQVGCVLTDDDFKQIAVGYNGTYRGGPNDCLMPGEDPCGCIHAEVNALVKARFRPTWAFVTTSPCLRCATLLINARVRSVVIGTQHANQNGTALLRKAGVGIQMLSCYSHDMSEHHLCVNCGMSMESALEQVRLEGITNCRGKDNA